MNRIRSMEISCKNADFLELSTEILGKGNYLRFCVKGVSMYPFIRTGEVIKVKPINGSDINTGDIIFYRTSWGGMVAHRVIKKHREINEMILLTKGDGSLNFDKPVHEDDIIGKVTAIEKSNTIIILDSKISQVINYMIVMYSLLVGFLKKDWDGGKNFSFYILSFIPKILSNTLFIVYKLKSI